MAQCQQHIRFECQSVAFHGKVFMKYLLFDDISRMPGHGCF